MDKHKRTKRFCVWIIAGVIWGIGLACWVAGSHEMAFCCFGSATAVIVS